MKRKNQTLFFVTLLGFISNFLLAQENSPFVTNDSRRAELSKEITIIELEMAAIFNANEENEDLHLNCNKNITTGTRYAGRTCIPQFFLDALSDQAEAELIFENRSRNLPIIQRDNIEKRISESNYLAQDRLRNIKEHQEKQLDNLTKLAAAINALTKENRNYAQLLTNLNKYKARLRQLSRQ